jgi:hypothetical protein
MNWNDRLPTFEQWGQLFGACERSAVHLEMRDSYDISDEDSAFAAWKAGHRDDLAAWWRPWLDLIKETTGRGVQVRRARVVSEPVTEYIRFEYEITYANVAAGEQVRWLPRRAASALALPGNDFWLLDGRRVLFNHFTGDGQELGHEWSEDPDVIGLCEAAFEAVWQRAIPHEEYLPA